MSKQVTISEIIVDPRLQLRASGTEKSVVDRYFTAMTEFGAELPPVTVFRESNGTFWLADGFHTVEAHIKAKREKVSADVKHGGFQEALEFAAGANNTHGEPRKPKDKRRAVMALLEHGWQSKADNLIAKKVGVSNHLVADVRSEWVESQKQLGDFQVAEVREGSDGKTRKAKGKPKADAEQPAAPVVEQPPVVESVAEPAQPVAEKPKTIHDIQQEAKSLIEKLVGLVGCAKSMIMLGTHVGQITEDKEIAYNLIVQAPIEVIGEEIFSEKAANICRDLLVERSQVAQVAPQKPVGLEEVFRREPVTEAVKTVVRAIGGIQKTLDQIELVTTADKRAALGKDFKARSDRLLGGKKVLDPKKLPDDFDEEGFERFWKVYPRHTAKENARFAYLKAIAEVSLDEMVAKAGVYAKYIDATGAEVCHAATWLNQKRWQDELKIPRKKGVTTLSGENSRFLDEAHDDRCQEVI